MSYKAKQQWLIKVSKGTDWKFRKLLNECIRRKWISKTWNSKSLIFHNKELFNFYQIENDEDFPNHELLKINIDAANLTEDILEKEILELHYDNKKYAYVKEDPIISKSIRLKESKIKSTILQLNSHKSYLTKRIQMAIASKSTLHAGEIAQDKCPLIYLQDAMKWLGLNSIQSAHYHIKNLIKRRSMSATKVLTKLPDMDHSINLYPFNGKLKKIYGEVYMQDANFYRFKKNPLKKVHPFVSFFDSCAASVIFDPIQDNINSRKNIIKDIRKILQKPAFRIKVINKIINSKGEVIAIHSFTKYRKYYKEFGKQKTKTGACLHEIKILQSDFDFSKCFYKNISNSQKDKDLIQVDLKYVNTLYYLNKLGKLNGSNDKFEMKLINALDVFKPVRKRKNKEEILKGIYQKANKGTNELCFINTN